ncbi:spore coat protein CotJB [Heliophilum fasciatum]|uniref:Spore coat protein JB n=1 Tax=Heliophilum fasciatum TaxID=35700 RepID=A0A4R2RP46_9FIRM|nr:spore coat protein CotJB [Heliophilum fasciatum]MCW2277625.1 spore coat protein JB [Heliophilum fasciatum]TCP64973.1 spore coat protein JB [Heliophilum fasciatum]
MDSQQREMLRRLQALEFVLTDLNLYLDTHPDCQAALQDFARISEDLRQLKIAYEQRYGLLTVAGFGSGRSPWNWVETPWPWEIDG